MDLRGLAVILLLMSGCAGPEEVSTATPSSQADAAVAPSSWSLEFKSDPFGRLQVSGVNANPLARVDDSPSCVLIQVKGLAVHEMTVEATWPGDQRLRVVQFAKDDSGSVESFQDRNGQSPLEVAQTFADPLRRDNVYGGVSVAGDVPLSAGLPAEVTVKVDLVYSGEGAPEALGTFNCENMFPGFPVAG